MMTLPETDQDWQAAIAAQKTKKEQAEHDSYIRDLILDQEMSHYHLTLAHYEVWQLRNELATLRRTLAAREATPPPVMPVGSGGISVKPVGITTLADSLMDEEPTPAAAPPKRHTNQWTAPPPLPDNDMHAASWEDQVAAVWLYREEFPEASQAQIVKALHLPPNKVHYIMTGERYPSEVRAKVTYRPLPPKPIKPRTTPLPEPPRPVRPTAVEMGIKLDPDTMLMKTA